MSKMEWSRPEAVVEKFVANEYVAACGDTEYGMYKFECNAGIQYSGNKNYHYKVWTKDGRVLASRWTGGYYGPCGATHEASTQDEFLEGYMDDIDTPQNEKIAVIIWTDHGTDVHCTTNLNRDSWELTKS